MVEIVLTLRHGTLIGTKFVLLTSLHDTNAESLLQKVYEAYADMGMKNPFLLPSIAKAQAESLARHRAARAALPIRTWDVTVRQLQTPGYPVSHHVVQGRDDIEARAAARREVRASGYTGRTDSTAKARA